MVKTMSIEEKKKIAEDIMKEMQNRLNADKDLLEGWGKTVQVVFTDIETGYRLKFAMDGSVEPEKAPASEIKDADAAGTVYCTVQTLKDVVDGKTSAMEAMNSGLFRIEGGLDAMVKLAPAIM